MKCSKKKRKKKILENGVCNSLGRTLTTLRFPIFHGPLFMKETIRHVCSIEYVHCLVDLICMYVSDQTVEETQGNLFKLTFS